MNRPFKNVNPESKKEWAKRQERLRLLGEETAKELLKMAGSNRTIYDNPEITKKEIAKNGYEMKVFMFTNGVQLFTLFKDGIYLRGYAIGYNYNFEPQKMEVTKEEFKKAEQIGKEKNTPKIEIH